jgi:hypothetical protein
MPVTVMSIRLTVLPHARSGDRPRMQRVLPHIQLDQLPDADSVDELVALCLQIPCVRSKQSRMAEPGCHALYLPDAYAIGPPEAFIDDHEFCHVHPLPQGNVHLTLPKFLRDEVVRLGWGERHPIAEAGFLTTLVTLYAPRDRQDIATVYELIVQSCHFARGILQVPQAAERSLRQVP